ncbi:MAG: hypothetical protein Q9209_006962 [Squamulea sp. 1 TL-2023]
MPEHSMYSPIKLSRKPKIAHLTTPRGAKFNTIRLTNPHKQRKMPSPKSSLSTTSPPPSSPHRLPSDASVIRPNNSSFLVAANKQPPLTQCLTINVSDPRGGAVPAVLHLPSNCAQGTKISKAKTAAILLSGAGGGLVGPSSIYLGIATKLSSLSQGIPVMRLDYRFPARNRYCVADVLAAMSYLEKEHAVSKFVLVGWSFGGAPVFTVAGNDERVVGCATVASQTAETDGVERLAPRPLLLLHGSDDQTLGSWCAESLYRRYGEGGKKEMKLFEGDDHALTRNAKEAEEMLCRFVMRCAEVEIVSGEGQVLKEEVVKVVREEAVRMREEAVHGNERVELMKRAGDLGGDERIE